MWIDRLTGDQIDRLPDVIEPGRYLDTDPSSGRQVLDSEGSGLLVSDGTESVVIRGQRHIFASAPKSLDQKVDLFERILETIDSSLEDDGDLVSPLMPEGVVNEDSLLNAFELKLLEIIDAGHLHQISMRPRLDLHYEDEVTDVARAKKLAKGALVHLASHSECWQRQTLSGVIPKRVKARFSEDDFNIYENRVYARLLDKIEQYLIWRVGTLLQLQSAVTEALEFYGANDLHHRLTEEICKLWGKAFTQDSTSKASEQLAATLEHLEKALGTIRGLKQSGLYLLVSRSAQIGNGLHLTNILSHDQHYRHLAVLWNELKSIVGGKQATPEERKEQNVILNHAYSRYAGLVLRHALLPYLGNKLSSKWARFNIELRQVGFDWQLVLSSADSDSDGRILLEVIPWMSMGSRLHDVSFVLQEKERPVTMIAWPNIDDKSLCSGGAATEAIWVQLSPFDLYCVERFGLLVDKLLQSELVSGYSAAITKVPTKTLKSMPFDAGFEVNEEKHQFRILKALTNEHLSKVESSLVHDNALQQTRDLKRRHEEIVELQKCPVCSGPVEVVHQAPSGFIAACSSCKTNRYLRGNAMEREYEQSLDGLISFELVGRRSFLCKL
ncbi:hypothetical protein CLV44_11480 [Marinobacterium halophilum]|uniref:DUF2357 domain-containing protein n=1 Tax=Marinobacterium halophilum TaxID=267374 RepID=A0A2P8EUE5_9GAMM|nr:hypothetical protein [Marinobacterium halophilum]PSL13083.1 hypothetical protein CLV44_11480 [Marinobacterium halophilum]